MRIRPSIHGFYIRDYLFATVIAAIMLIAGIYMFFETREGLISSGLVALAALIVAAGLAHSTVNRKTTYLELTDEQLIYDSGILSHSRVVAPISQITDTAIKRTFFERICGIANLLVNTSGTGSVEIYAEDFSYDDVASLNNEINRMIAEAAKRGGYKQHEAGAH
ncbi:MAG: PH domain-containing protein [Candidatus Micrarchaeota archaeon]